MKAMTAVMEPVQVVCCNCGKTRVGQQWFDLSEVEMDGVRSSHGYCPRCFEKALMSLGQMMDTRGDRDDLTPA